MQFVEHLLVPCYINSRDDQRQERTVYDDDWKTIQENATDVSMDSRTGQVSRKVQELYGKVKFKVQELWQHTAAHFSKRW